ncbi:MAG: aminoglycoside phosphotransferase, partial [Rhizobacter sp.]|nr:aminoglycoside phosphotransferase [Rhizobacter sp.]
MTMSIDPNAATKAAHAAGDASYAGIEGTAGDAVDARDTRDTRDTRDAGLAGFDAEVLSEGSPELDSDWVRSIASQHWGIVGEMVPLTGERDRNYRLRSAADGALTMLKISHPLEKPLVADFQTQALLHIERVDAGLPVQRMVRTLVHEASIVCTPADGLPRVARLFSYLPGLPMPDAPRTASQQCNLARTLARLDIALGSFEHPAGAMALPWDIQRADSVRSLLRH